MNLLSRILGPESKYDHGLPFTYEAKVRVAGVEGLIHGYVSDTLCGLLERLDAERIGPGEVEILEVRPEGECPVPVEYCTGADRKWLHRPETCRSFEARFAGHEKTGRCCYRDRSREAEGPFVEYEPRGATAS